MKDKNWLALMIGNSRLHWGYFWGDILKKTWNTPHIKKIEELNPIFASQIPFLSNDELPLYVASVVVSQTTLFQKLSKTIMIQRHDIPIKNVYPTIGIDRILALYGAGCIYGFPCLVIDGGTALTFTGVNINKNLVGGAILPGLSLQFKSLASHTDALHHPTILKELPPRWGKNTSDAIRSGIIYTILAGINNFIQDWQTQFPTSKIILTGGDGIILQSYLESLFPKIAAQVTVDSDLIFWGMMRLRIYRENCSTQDY